MPLKSTRFTYLLDGGVELQVGHVGRDVSPSHAGHLSEEGDAGDLRLGLPRHRHEGHEHAVGAERGLLPVPHAEHDHAASILQLDNTISTACQPGVILCRFSYLVPVGEDLGVLENE